MLVSPYFIVATPEKKKKKQMGADELELKLEEFYSSLEEDEKMEKLEDIRRLASESKELLRKVDALVELLLRAAQEEGDEEEIKTMLTEVSNGISEIEDHLKLLEELGKKVDAIPPEFENIRSSIEELKTFVSSSVSQSLSPLAPKIDKLSDILPSISERMSLLEEKAKNLDKLEKLDGLDDLYRKNAEIYDHVVTLKSAVESATEAQTKLLSRRLAAIYKRVRSLESVLGELEDIKKDVGETAKSESVEAVKSKVESIAEELESLKASLAGISEELKQIDELRARMDTLIVSMDHVPKNVESVVEEHVARMESSLSSVPQELSEEIQKSTTTVVSKVESVEEKLSELEELRAELVEVKRLVAEREKDREWMEHQFELLEKEIESLNLAIDAVNKAIAGSLDERKKAIQKLTKRTEKIIETLHQLQVATSEEDAERLAALQKSLQDMFANLSETLTHISAQEEEEYKLFKDYVDHIDERMSALEKMLEEDVTKSTVSAVRKELSEISKKLVALTDLMHKNTGLLTEHSGDVAELIARFHSLDEKLSELEAKSSETPAKLVEMQKRLEEELDTLREQIIAANRELRKHRDSEVIKSIQTLKESMSVIHSELMGILEAVKKYDTTSKLAELSKRLDELQRAVQEGRADQAAANRELAEIEEQIAQISSVISEADVKAVKAKLEDIYRVVDSVASAVKNARAILDEGELKGILKDMEALRAYAREVREAGLSDELDEIRSKVKKLREVVESEIRAVKEGKVHHMLLLNHHSDVKRIVIPVSETAAHVKHVAAVKEAHAKRIKSAAKDLADRTGSAHAHLVAAHSDRIIRTARTMKEIERLVKRIQKKLDTVEAEAQGKAGSKARRELSKLAERDLVLAAATKIAKIVKRMKKGEVKTSDEIAEDLGVREDIVKKALDRIAKTGELAVEVKRPLLPFLGKHYTVIRL